MYKLAPNKQCLADISYALLKSFMHFVIFQGSATDVPKEPRSDSRF